MLTASHTFAVLLAAAAAASAAGTPQPVDDCTFLGRADVCEHVGQMCVDTDPYRLNSGWGCSCVPAGTSFTFGGPSAACLAPEPPANATATDAPVTNVVPGMDDCVDLGRDAVCAAVGQGCLDTDPAAVGRGWGCFCLPAGTSFTFLGVSAACLPSAAPTAAPGAAAPSPLPQCTATCGAASQACVVMPPATAAGSWGCAAEIVNGASVREVFAFEGAVDGIPPPPPSAVAVVAQDDCVYEERQRVCAAVGQTCVDTDPYTPDQGWGCFCGPPTHSFTYGGPAPQCVAPPVRAAAAVQGGLDVHMLRGGSGM